MKVITCPESLDLDAPYNKPLSQTHVFVGGGISNCADWQKEMIARFRDQDDNLTLINPRRTSFNITDPSESAFQIKWEHDHIKRSDAMIFWFPWETLCPITLYELGIQVGKRNKIFVGCHPAYQRKFDVEYQLACEGYAKPHDNFETLVEEVKFWHNN